MKEMMWVALLGLVLLGGCVNNGQKELGPKEIVYGSSSKDDVKCVIFSGYAIHEQAVDFMNDNDIEIVSTAIAGIDGSGGTKLYLFYRGRR